LREYQTKLKAWEKAKSKGDRKTRQPRAPKEPFPRMQPEEDGILDKT
jgi:hypothetical protein